MMQLTRRKLFAGAAAASAATALTPLLGRDAFAATPPAGKQVTGVYRYKVGSYECTSINDGSRTFPMPDTFVKNAPKDQALAAAEAAYMPKGMVTMPFNPQVINTGSKLVLIDAGYGPGICATRSVSCPWIWRRPASIRKRSISSCSRICIPTTSTGVKTADGKVAFPNAEIMVPGVDWAFWMNDENAAKAEPDCHDEELLRQHHREIRQRHRQQGDEVRLRARKWRPASPRSSTPGHTPGHTSFAVASGSAQVLVQSDVTNIPAVFPAQSGLALSCSTSIRKTAAADAPQVLRHGGGREGAGDRLPLPVPIRGLCREGRHRLSADADRVEPGDLSDPARQLGSEGRRRWRPSFLRAARACWRCSGRGATIKCMIASGRPR